MLVDPTAVDLPPDGWIDGLSEGSPGFGGVAMGEVAILRHGSHPGARWIIAALQDARPGEVFNVVDDEPVTQTTYFRWLAEELGKDLPPSAPDEPDAARKRGAANKRVSNRKLKMELGCQLKYPNFRKGFSAEIQRLFEASELPIAPAPH